MCDLKLKKSSLDVQKNNRKDFLKMIDPAFTRFVTQLPQKLNDCLQSRIGKTAEDHEATSLNSNLEKEGQVSAAFEGNLERQLQAWKENPVWDDQPPEIRVNVPKGSLCNLKVKVNVGLPPDAVYNIVIDPENRRVFKNIKEVISRKVLVDEGSRQLVEVEQAALWKFLWWSGTIPVHVLVDQNREDYSMKFKQLKTGFMKKFEGSWRVEPLFVDEKSCFPFKPLSLAEYDSCTGGKGRVGSQVCLDQLIQPAIVPPPPISWYLRGITAKTTEMLINDLVAEAAKIRGRAGSGDSDQAHDESQCISDECQLESRDIKERWSLHRKNARKSRKRLPWTAGSTFN